MALRMSRRSGFTLIELMAVSAILSVLGAQLFPAVQQAREAARRSQCKNNLKQIGLALHNYHETYNKIPNGWIGVDSKTQKPDVFGLNGWGWGARFLPYLDQSPLFNRMSFRAQLDDEVNVKFLATSVPTFRCPSDLFTKKTWKIQDDKGEPLAELATSNYVGSFGTDDLAKCEKTKPGEVCQSNGLFFHNSGIGFAAIRDGLSNTIAVGERIGDEKIDHLSTWTGVIAKGKSPFSRILGSSNAALKAKERHASDYLSAHVKGSHFLLTDGSVRFIDEKLELKTFQALTTRDGGEVIEEF